MTKTGTITIIILLGALMLLISGPVSANELDDIEMAMERKLAHVEPTPDYFKDSNIKRRLKDGSIQKFDGDKYKIVPRAHTHKKPAPRPVCCQFKPLPAKKQFRNRVNLIVGYGARGTLMETREPGYVGYRTENGGVAGLQYLRDVSVREDYAWTIGVQAQTNRTFSVMGGVGF